MCLAVTAISAGMVVAAQSGHPSRISFGDLCNCRRDEGRSLGITLGRVHIELEFEVGYKKSIELKSQVFESGSRKAASYCPCNVNTLT